MSWEVAVCDPEGVKRWSGGREGYWVTRRRGHEVGDAQGFVRELVWHSNWYGGGGLIVPGYGFEGATHLVKQGVFVMVEGYFLGGVGIFSVTGTAFVSLTHISFVILYCCCCCCCWLS